MNDGLDEKINAYNEKLQQWSTANGMKSLKTNMYFKLGTGDLDNMCYEVNDMSEASLNRYGVIRLLGAINKQCKHLKLSDNFTTGKRNFKVYEQNMENHEEDFYENYQRNTHQEIQQQNRELRGSSSYRYKNVNRGNGFPARGLRNRRTPEYPSPPSSGRQRCFNCGEYNHHQSACRYDHRVRCNHCLRYGHKSRMCNDNMNRY